MSAIHPDLEAQVAGVAGARNFHRDVAQSGLRKVEILELRRAKRLQDRPGHGPLQRQRGDRIRYISDLDVHAGGVVFEPAQVRLRRGHAEDVVAKTRDGTVVDHLAGVIAPWRVEHLTNLSLQDVARHDEIQEARGVATPDPILIERRHIEERRRRADNVIFTLVRKLV